jgi:uncharacterized membrane protein SpoIIM required for sporulation
MHLVIEHLFSSKRIEREPWLVALMAFMFVAIAVSITRLIYFQGPPKAESLYGIFIIALAVMPSIPFFLHEIITEEKRQEFRCKGSGFFTVFSCYSRLITFYSYFFIGTVLGFAFCAAILPGEISDAMFLAQQDEMKFFSAPSAQATAQFSDLQFAEILFHNIQVLILMLVFSFIYSIGSIFLLVWNASLVGIFLESFIRNSFSLYSKFGLLGFPTAFAVGSFTGLIRLLPHGIFEISAFFVASIAGGIMSVAIERRMYRKSNIMEIAGDVVKLLFIAFSLLAIGAFIESSYA